MPPIDRTELYDRIVDLRTQVFETLDELGPPVRFGESDANTATLVELQNVANQLGALEAALRQPPARAA